jgi:hypothetical protein
MFIRTFCRGVALRTGISASLGAALVIAATSVFLPHSAGAQSANDSTAIRAAVLDYVEGFYEGDTARLVRSVRPEVVKTGFAADRNSAKYNQMSMPWEEFHRYANRIKAGAATTPPNAVKQIEILDAADQIAVAKLTAWWGIDYLNLAKFDGKWQIVQVIWQSPPK